MEITFAFSHRFRVPNLCFLRLIDLATMTRKRMLWWGLPLGKCFNQKKDFSKLSICLEKIIMLYSIKSSQSSQGKYTYICKHDGFDRRIKSRENGEDFETVTKAITVLLHSICSSLQLIGINWNMTISSLKIILTMSFIVSNHPRLWNVIILYRLVDIKILLQVSWM